MAFAEAGLDYREYVKIDERLPSGGGELLVGDAMKAREALGWEPRYTFAEIVKEMVEGDLSTVARQPRAVRCR